MQLDTQKVSNIIQVLYVWIDGTGQTMRCKTKSVFKEPMQLSDCPIWNFDGSSTGLAEGHNSDIYLHPVALFQDPFRGLPNKIVLCETCSFEEKATHSNRRKTCNEVYSRKEVQVSVHGMTPHTNILGIIAKFMLY